jgi:hypothetical protein
MLQQHNSGERLLAFAQLLHIQAINPVIIILRSGREPALARAASAAAAASTDPNHRHKQSSPATCLSLLEHLLLLTLSIMRIALQPALQDMSAGSGHTFA